MGAIGRSFPPPAESLLAAVEKDGAVRMRNPGRVLALAALLSLVYGAALVAVLSLRRDLAHLPPAWLIWFGSAWFAGFAALFWVGLMPGRGRVSPRLFAGFAGAAAATAVFFAAGFLFAEHAPGHSVMTPDGIWPFFRIGRISR